MSTRANIVLTDGYDKMYFYRHSDGYPEGAMPGLEKFIDAVKRGLIRDNVAQSGGWLIAIGQEEYGNTVEKMLAGENEFYGWKVGAIEPTTGIHGDIEFLYHIDLQARSITVHTSNFDAFSPDRG